MPAFVGRERELEAIDQALRALVNGKGGTLFIVGEPGIGKSALARVLAGHAEQQALPVYWGFCWEAGGAPAYWPWTQALRSLLLERDVPPDALAKLGQLLPEVPGRDDTTELQPDQARFQLLEAMRALVDRESRLSPFVVILEDMHAADADSLHLLQYMARYTATMPMLVVATYRDVEARHSASPESLWAAGRDAEVLHLPRLDRNAVCEFLGAQGDDAATDDKVRHLLETTEGNPLFLTELVGLMGRQQDGQLPRTVQQVINQQIALLPETTVVALGYASVIGREFEINALAALRGLDAAATESEIEPAVSANLLQVMRPGRYRFSHVLHRDVLYQGLEGITRQVLHVRCAEYIGKLIEGGDKDRWSIYAMHLQAAGSDYSNDAVAAWQKSAHRAHARLAFDDAARSLRNALDAFGEGPKFDPVARCELQLHYAEALFLVGRVADGHVQCRDAFAIARTLEDPALMSEAALTYGNALLVARVDKELVGMLRECLDVIPASDVAMKARVQARLAAAMQPSLKPGEPMEMAREAIALARTVDDESVLFAVLRSAISALMDFAPASERIPLNREFEALAARRGSVAGQFRSYLRLMFDAIEVGDRQMLDDTVDAAELVANRIALPHYQWRVASARAMQGMIDGDFARALACIDEAQCLAERVDDMEAKITLPVQRFSILCDWDSDAATPLQEIEAQFQSAYRSGMADTSIFVTPFLTAFCEPVADDGAAALLDNEAMIERTFSGGDRFSLTMIGEIAAKAGRPDLAERAYRSLNEFADECVTLGLLGGCWFGPAGYWLGRIALALGRRADAAAHFETALQLAARMRSQPYIGRVHLALAKLAAEGGDKDGAARHQRQGKRITKALSIREVARAPTRPAPPAEPPRPDTPPFDMRLDGDMRIVSFAGASATLKDNRGLQILARLIAAPDTEIHVLDLSGSSRTADSGNAGPHLDDKARAEYKHRIADLQEELAEAESLGDAGRADELRGELEFITRELSAAYGLGGRGRRTGSAAERARVNVRRRLKDAIERIGRHLPEAGRYLENTIKTGSYCKYSPM